MKHSSDIRRCFLDFFSQQGHTVVPPSSLIPGLDPTLLFTNAGMVPFKDVFLGLEKRPYVRAVSVQPCVRAGGKHNDLKNVGHTARHLTFFEMLGNFSFGDYFKKEAITMAWTFLTEVLALPADRLWVTVYHSDKDAEDIWLKDIGVSPTRFSHCGDADNFWSMGDTGPCGPCTEIFYDHGPTVAGGPPGSLGADGDRYTEIWNIVFMQYERSKDGVLHPLPKPSVDTGMGLERLSAVLQGVHSNFAIDSFQNLRAKIRPLLPAVDVSAVSLNILADHLRSSVFLMLDGVHFSNEGRGYVLRRIVRRALRYGFQAGAVEPFFYRCIPALVMEMGEAYPALRTQEHALADRLRREEEQFAKTLKQGLHMVEKIFAEGQGLSGEMAFILYDTYGFPYDLTADLAREQGIILDEKAFEKALSEQRERSRAASSFGSQYADLDLRSFISEDLPKTVFCGYTQGAGLQACKANIQALHRHEKTLWLVCDRSPFYTEAGGQIGDTGVIENPHFTMRVEKVLNQGGRIVHQGTWLSGEYGSEEVHTEVFLSVDGERRFSIAAHHSATHLLHAAVRQVIGDSVQQKGSWVGEERLRLDLTLQSALTESQYHAIERLVNEEIRKNTEILTREMSLEEAKKEGAMALFGETYGETVRVLSMGDGFSVECCGGTHVTRTGDIGAFILLSDAAIASGVRRLEACVGQQAVLQWQEGRAREKQCYTLLKSDSKTMIPKIEELQNAYKSALKTIEQQKLREIHLFVGNTLLATQEEIDGIPCILQCVPDDLFSSLKSVIDALKGSLKRGVAVLCAVRNNEISLSVGVWGEPALSAVDVFKHIAPVVTAQGGGKQDFAQGKGSDPSKIEALLLMARDRISRRVKGST
jgi:alanyl-tRNA synthetase